MKTRVKSNEQRADDEKALDVLIIGSGWAGIGAGCYLQGKKIHNFKILDARDYIGGRSRTIMLDDNKRIAELGSSWVHVAKQNNPMVGVLKTLGINVKKLSKTKEVESNDEVWMVDGTKDDGSTTSHLLTDIEKEKVDEKYYSGSTGFHQYQQYFQDNCDEVSLRRILDGYLETENFARKEKAIIEWAVDSEIVSNYSGSMEDLSLYYWNSDLSFDGIDLHLARDLKGGYGSLVEKFSRPFKDKICLNSKVISIDWNTSIVAVTYLSSDGTEQTLFAKKVIVTVPLGVLKAKTMNFSPEIPEGKMEAIRRIGVGHLNKCILVWDKNEHLPWQDDVRWIEIISCQGKQGWFTEFYRPKTVRGRVHKILYVFLSGKYAEEMERLSDETIQEEALKSLRSVYEDVPSPKQVVVSRWGNDEYAKGAYSFNRVNQSPNDRRVLERPLKKRVYFAGEATSRYYFGTCHGAMLSGLAAAKNTTRSFPFNLW